MDENWQNEEKFLYPYKIYRQLPSPGKGRCYLVKHSEWEMPLRLKTIPLEDLSEKSLQVLRHAWRRWIGMSGHPHIVHAYREIMGKDSLYSLTEYVHGINLREYIERGVHEELQTPEEFSRQCALVVVQLAYALHFAHRHRLVHGKLSPENILISGETLLLGDFYGPGDSLEFETLDCSFHRDIESYGRILRYVFYGIPVDVAGNSPLGNPGSEVPPALPELIEKLLASPLSPPCDSLRKTAFLLRESFEKYDKNALKYCPLLSVHWHVENLHKHAFSWMTGDNREQAEQLWHFAGNRQPPSLCALWNLYLSHLRQGLITLENLIESMEHFQERMPPEILCAQSQLAMELGSHIHSYLEKIQRYHATVESTPHLLRVEGDLFYRIGKFEEATARFQKLIKRESAQPDDWYRLAIAYRQTLDIDTASRVCRDGLARFPQHQLLQLVQVYCNYILRGPEEVRSTLADLLRQYPDSLWVLIHAGEFYGGQGLYRRTVSEDDKKAARSCFTRALNLNPNSPRVIRDYLACDGDLVPQAASADMDGWSEIKCLGSHPNMVTAAILSKDEKWAISGDCEGNLYLWDVQSESCVTRLEGHRKHISSLACTADCTCVASASWDQTVRLWEIPSGKCVWKIDGHRDKVSCVSITPDGSWLITGSWDGTARVWDTRTKRQIATLDMDDWITDVAITGNGLLAISCDHEDHLWLWETNTQNVISRMQGTTMSLSCDSRLLVSSMEGGIQIWEVETGTLVKEIATRGKEKCLALTADKLLLVTRNEDDMLSLWNLWSGRRLAVLAAEDIMCGNISPEGRYLICGERERVYVWENVTDRDFPLVSKAGYLPPDLREYRRMPGLIESLWSKAEAALTRGEDACAIEVYRAIRKIPGYENADEAILDAVAARPVRSLANVHFLMEQMPGIPTAIAIASPEFALVADNGRIYQWNLRTGYRVGHVGEHRRCVSALAVSGDGRLALSGSWDGTVRVWSTDYPGQSELLGTHGGWITSLAMTPDGAYAIYGTRQGEVVLCDVARRCCRRLCSSKKSVSGVALTRDYALSALEDGTVSTWDVKQGTCLNTVRPHRRFVTAITFSPDGQSVASAARDGNILLWETATGRITFARTTTGVIRGLSFVQEHLLSMSESGVLQLWRAGEENCLARYSLIGEEGQITAWAMTANGCFVAVTDDGKKMRLWKLEWE